MARYLVVQVDENDRAEKLAAKLDEVAGIDVIGIFGKPTQFCECEGPWENSIRGKKYGWNICPTCGKPRKDGPHQRPLNLLWSSVPLTMQNLVLAVREPYQTPLEMYGQEKIDAQLRTLARTRQVIKEFWAKQARRGRRPRGRR